MTNALPDRKTAFIDTKAGQRLWCIAVLWSLVVLLVVGGRVLRAGQTLDFHPDIFNKDLIYLDESDWWGLRQWHYSVSWRNSPDLHGPALHAHLLGSQPPIPDWVDITGRGDSALHILYPSYLFRIHDSLGGFLSFLIIAASAAAVAYAAYPIVKHLRKPDPRKDLGSAGA
jgi:hypothetical protein